MDDFDTIIHNLTEEVLEVCDSNAITDYSYLEDKIFDTLFGHVFELWMVIRGSIVNQTGSQWYVVNSDRPTIGHQWLLTLQYEQQEYSN